VKRIPVAKGRRQFVGGAIAMATAMAMPARLLAQDAGGGRKVWMDMTQEELDAAYNQGQYAPNRDLVFARWREQNSAARSRLGDPEIHAYGKTPIEKLHVYRGTGSGVPVHIFVHGGAWQGGSAAGYAFVAEPIVNAGGVCVLLDFASIDDDGIGLGDMCHQVRDAVAWVHRNAEMIGGDRRQIHVSGHSSGGHLAGVILTTDWEQDYDLPADTVRTGICVSGIFDLAPVRLSFRNDYVQLTDEEEERYSAQRQLEHLSAPVILAYGTQETPEFQRQSRDFAKALELAGKPVQLVVADGYNHFEIMETFANPYGLIGRKVLEQMGLTA